jgi:hypothetical protein
MSIAYDNYLTQHEQNVCCGLEWIKNHLPELLSGDSNYDWQIAYAHDSSKSTNTEYDAYDKYFYGGNRSYKVVQDFNYAWLQHIHSNPHHWQHWVLINDDPNEGEIIMDMPYNYIIEMICDWWAFSWKNNDLYEIFKWYDEHKDYMKLSAKTRTTVEDILEKIKNVLDDPAIDK